jgi:hypothetical protein
MFSLLWYQAGFLNTENIVCNGVLVGTAKGLIKIPGLHV